MRSKCRCSCVLQFTFRRAVSCVLHRPPSQVIHCTVLCFKHCSASAPGIRINSFEAYIPSLGWATIQLESSPSQESFPWRRNLRGLTTPGNTNSSHQRTGETESRPAGHGVRRAQGRRAKSLNSQRSSQESQVWFNSLLSG